MSSPVFAAAASWGACTSCILLINPVASPLFLPTVRVIVIFLGGALLALVLLARGSPSRLLHGALFARWRVWAVIAPVYALALLSGALTTLLLLTFLVFQGLREYNRLVNLPGGYARMLLALGLLAAPVALVSLDAFLFLPPILLIVATLQPILLSRQEHGVRHLAFAALGWGYIAWFLAHLMLLYRYVDGGPGILLALGFGTAASDVGAFVVGKRFGRHKLAPGISPNKTVEGVAGNIVGAFLGVAVMAFAVPDRLRPVLLVALPLVIALGAIWGDLLESSIKREFQAKDAGAWLPGFGGLLDRIDSLIIVVPLVFYVLRLVG